VIALLDTHILLWWFEQPKRLSLPQRRILARANAAHPLGVSDTTLWEVALLVEVGRVRLALPIDQWLSRATAAPRVELCATTPEIARELASLATTRGWDPADRLLVATARVFGVPLVTSDARILESGLVRTVH
jgi:PIN domain nuclease of toxin-antitoxin system